METEQRDLIKKEKTNSRHRWIMLVIVMVMTMLFSTVLLMPSSLLTTISKETGWSMGQTGTFNSIVSLLMGIFAFLGSFILDKLGTKKTAIIALAIGGLGCIVAFFSGTNYMLHITGRFLFGVSFGVFCVVPGVVISDWFSSDKQSLYQGMRGSFDMFGAGISYYIVIPIFLLTKSWQITFGVFGIVMIAMMFIYLFFGREKPCDYVEANQEKIGLVSTNNQNMGLVRAAKNKYVWFIVISMIGKIFAFNTFNTYLPAFLEYERGYSTAVASGMTGLTALIGIASGVVMGAFASAVGRRKVMGPPMLICVSLGGFLAIMINSSVIIALGCLLIGWGVTGYMAFYLTIPVDISNGDPSFIAGATALIMGIPFIVAYFVPNVFQGLVDSGLSIKMAMLMALIPNTLFMVLAFLIPETGPAAQKKKKQSNITKTI